jgi:NAD(P)-dependent dehydrogenase (short-subunit alcohol dehydrogenase family)
MRDLFFVADRHIFITGASSGLGEHFAKTLSERGARVSLAARRTERLQNLVKDICTTNGKAQAISMDVSDSESVAAGFDEAKKQFGAVDVAINNAGTAGRAPSIEMPAEEWLRIIDVNLNGTWYVAQQVGKQMIESGNGGSLINIASIMAYRQKAGLAAYCSSKAGVIHLTHVLALEWATHNIRVNAIAPGYIHSEMTDAVLASEAGKKMIANTPQQRAGNPEDLDGALLLLCSDASSFMTGSTITVDGGHLQTPL